MMARSLWSAFHGEVLPAVSGCPEPFADNAIRNAATVFCERTRVWQANLPPIVVHAGRPVLPYFVPNLLDAGATWSHVAPTQPTRERPMYVLGPDDETMLSLVEDLSTTHFSGRFKTLTVPNDGARYCYSAFVLKTTGGTAPTFAVNLNLTGGAGVAVNRRLNTDTGAGNFDTVIDAGSYWLIAHTITNNSSGNTSLQVSEFPASGPYHADPTSSNDNVATTGGAVWFGSQLVQGEGAVMPHQSEALAQTRVHVILDARIGNKEVSPRRPDELIEIVGPDWRTRTGEPLFVTQENEHYFRLVPYPVENDLGELLHMRVALKPAEGATGIDSAIYEEHKLKIAAGAIGMLMLTADEPYFNADLAAVHGGRFSQAIGDTNWRVAKGRVRSRIKSKGHYF